MITKNIAKTERTTVGHHTNTARTERKTVRTPRKHCTAGELHKLANNHAGLTRLKAELKGVHTTSRQRYDLTQATVGKISPGGGRGGRPGGVLNFSTKSKIRYFSKFPIGQPYLQAGR